MDVEKIAEITQTVAELNKGERDYFDGLVADATSFAKAQERLAQLRKLPDRDAINYSMMLARRGPLATDIDLPAVVQFLAEAGFERFPEKPAPMTTLLIGDDNPAKFEIRAPNESFESLLSVLEAAGHKVRFSKSA